MSKAIYRHPEGISLNGREWLLDDDGNWMEFDTYDQAKAFLLGKGYKESHIDECVFIEDIMTCSKCGHKFSTENSYEVMHNRFICPDCKEMN